MAHQRLIFQGSEERCPLEEDNKIVVPRTYATEPEKDFFLTNKKKIETNGKTIS